MWPVRDLQLNGHWSLASLSPQQDAWHMYSEQVGFQKGLIAKVILDSKAQGPVSPISWVPLTSPDVAGNPHLEVVSWYWRQGPVSSPKKKGLSSCFPMEGGHLSTGFKNFPKLLSGCYVEELVPRPAPS